VKDEPKVFELVAGAGDNYAATAAPALGSAGGVKLTSRPPAEPTRAAAGPEAPRAEASPIQSAGGPRRPKPGEAQGPKKPVDLVAS
jgi:colicin import membrane protein